MYSPSSTFVVVAAEPYSPTSTVSFASSTSSTGYTPSSSFSVTDVPGGYSPTSAFDVTSASTAPDSLTVYRRDLNVGWQVLANPNHLATLSKVTPVLSLQGHGYLDLTAAVGSLPRLTSHALGAAVCAGTLPSPRLAATASGEWGALTATLPLPGLTSYTAAWAEVTGPSLRLMAEASGEWGSVSAVMPSWIGVATGAAECRGQVPTITLTGSTSPVWGMGAGVLPGLLAGAYAGASAAGTLTSMRLETRWGELNGALPGLSLAAEVTTGAVGRLDSTIFLAPGVLGYAGAELSVVFPRSSLTASATSESQARADLVLPRFSLYATATTESVAQLRGQLPLISLQWAGLDGRLPRLSLQGAPAYQQPGLGVETSLSQPVNWAINLTTGETTSYTQFPFQRVVRFADGFYGVNAGGLYRLGGDTNDGQPITATLETAPMDFDSLLMKRVPYLYVGMTAGQARVTSITDGVAYGPFSTNHGQRRVQLPRGAKGRYWGFRLVNWQGGPFRLDQLDVVVEPTTRRI